MAPVLGHSLFRFKSWDGFKLYFPTPLCLSKTEPLEAYGVAASIICRTNNITPFDNEIFLLSSSISTWKNIEILRYLKYY